LGFDYKADDDSIVCEAVIKKWIKIQNYTENKGRKSGAFDVESKPAMEEEKVVWCFLVMMRKKERRRILTGD